VVRKPPKISGPLLRYRVMAYVTGIMLLVLCVTVVIQVGYGNNGPVSIAGITHGWLYMIYVITALDLCLRMRWSLPRMALVVIAGTIPFLSFYTEHKIVGWVREELGTPAETPEASPST
jgi:integral membrane protein